MDSTRLTYLFHRYVNKSCTEAEEAEFLNMVGEARHEAALKDLLDQLWEDVSPRMLSGNRSQYMLNEILESGDRVIPLSRRTRVSWAKVAASLLLVALLSAVLLYYSGSHDPGAEVSVVRSSSISEANFIALPDGSTVILNAGSRLNYPAAFDGEFREVSLIGEGYFDIAHDPQRAFVVRTGKLKTTVLGTAFNIKAYPDQSDIIVTVTRGKVKVSDDSKVLGILNPDQQITFNRTRERSEQKMVDTHMVTAWMEKDIFFDDVTIEQALGQLEKRFNISIRLANQNMTNCRFTATFVKGEDVEQILRILCDFNNATLRLEGEKSFVIEGGKCPL